MRNAKNGATCLLAERYYNGQTKGSLRPVVLGRSLSVMNSNDLVGTQAGLK